MFVSYPSNLFLFVMFCLSNWNTIGYSESPSKNLTICFVWEDDSYWSDALPVETLVRLGIDHANEFILEHKVTLQFMYISTGNSCISSQADAAYAMYEYLGSGRTCDLLIGAGCPHTSSVIYGYARGLNVPLVGIPAAGIYTLQVGSSADNFPLLIQSAFAFSDMSRYLMGFLDHNNYYHVTVFRDESYEYFVSLSDGFLRAARLLNNQLSLNISTTTFQSTRTNNEGYKKYLVDGNERSRVFLLFMHGRAVRDLMIAAAELGYIQGSHVFIATELFGLDFWGRIYPVTGDEFDAVASEAFRSLLVISILNEQTDRLRINFETQVKVMAIERFNYTFGPVEPINLVLTAHYESVMMYATIVKSLLSQGQDYTDGQLLSPAASNASFDSPIGGKMYFSKTRARDRGYCMKHYEPSTKELQIILEYKTHAANRSYRFAKPLNWPSPNGLLPSDEPRCGFRANKCVASGFSATTVGLMVGIPLIILAAMAGTGFYFVRKVWSLMDVNPNWWRIPEEELAIKNAQNNKSSSKKTLRSQATGGTHYSAYVCELFASYNGTMVGLTDVSEMKRQPMKELVEEVKMLKVVEHANLQHFIGIAVTTDGFCKYIVAEICTKGCLTDVLENQVIKLDWLFKNLLIRDVISGMSYLHGTAVASHGMLSSHVCLMDSRFTLKITDYGLTFFRNAADLPPPRPTDFERDFEELLWRAPEFLRQPMPAKGTQKGDVYSFAIILQQIILRSGAFELPDEPLDLSAREIIIEVAASSVPPVRPRVPRSACSNELYDLMERCWEEHPLQRPLFPKIRERFQKITGNLGESIIDSLFKRMETYANDLEQKVADQTREFVEEKLRSEQLLSELLPKPVAAALTKGMTVDPEAFDCVTVFFSDVVGFTVIASKGTPMNVIELLNKLYTFFDEVLMKHDVYKVETIGDAYMVASGLPLRNGNKHVVEISCMALELVSGITKFVVPFLPTEVVHIRAGVNSGPCVTGIVGKKMPRYCLFGDTINVASRMESTGEPMRIQITYETKLLLNAVGGFSISERGQVQIKGKGVLTTFWLNGKL